MMSQKKNRFTRKWGLPALLILICFIAGAVWFLPEANSVTIKSVQRGSDTISGNTKSTSVTLGTAVDVQKSMIVFSNAGSGNPGPENCLSTAEFTASNTLYISRSAASGGTPNEWSVIEFKDGVTVQNGYSKISASNTSKTVYLGAAIDPDKSILLFNYQAPAEGSGIAEAYPYGEIVSANQLIFSRAYHNNVEACEITWQVIEFSEDVIVQKNVTQLTTETTLDVLLSSAVDTTKTVVIASAAATATGGNPDDFRVTAELKDANNITLKRQSNGATVDVSWMVLEFTDDTYVQTGTSAWAATIAINQPDLTRAFAYSNFNTTGTGVKDAIYEYQLGEIDAGSGSGTNQIYFATGGTATFVSWAMVEFAPLEITAPNGGELWRVNETKDITWNHADSVESGGTGYNGNHQIKIELSTDSGGTYPLLIYQSPATPAADETNCSSDSYSWTIPSTISSTDLISNSLRVKLTDLDAGTTNIAYTTSDADFEIIADVVLSYPVGGETISYEAATNITWTFYGDATTRTVTLKYDTDSGNNSFTDGTLGSAITADDNTFPVNWATNPLPLGDRVRVRIEQEQGEGSRVFDESASDFTVTADLTLTAPTGGETWQIGTSQDISWTANGEGFMPNGVKIELSRNGGGSYSQLNVAVVAADSSPWPWTVEAPDEIDARIRVSSVDFPTVSDASADFTIQQTLRVDVPNTTGIIWRVGESGAGRQIEWTTEGSVTTVDIYLDTGSGFNLIDECPASGVANSSPFTWTVPDVISDTCKIRVQDHDNPGVILDDSDNDFKIKGNISIISPALDEVLKVGVEKTLTFQVSGNVNGTADIKLKTSSGGTYTTIGTQAVSGANIYNVPWTPTLASHMGLDCYLKVEMQGDSETAGESDSFKIRGNIELTYPKAQTGVEVNIDDPADKLYIQWTPTPTDLGGGGLVNIRYDLNSGLDGYPEGNVVVSNLACDNNPGSGIGYEWQIPDTTGMVTNKMRVKVYQVGEEAYGVSDTSDVDFTVLGTITITGESNGDGSPTWEIGTNESITWTAKGDITPVKIYMSKTGGEPYNILIDGAYAAGSGAQSYDGWWPIPTDVLGTASVRETNVKFKVTSSDGSIEDVSDNPVIIQARLVLSKPNGSSVFTVVDPDDTPSDYTENQINWTYDGDGFDTANVDLKYDINNAGTFAGTIASTSAVSAGYSDWVVPDIIGNQIKVKVKAQGTDGDYVYDDSPDFVVKGQIKIVAPDPAVDGATVWYVDNAAAHVDFTSIENIQWKCFGTLGNGSGLTIEYAANGITYDTTLAASANADHLAANSLPWTIPDEIGTENRIRFTDNDGVNTPADTVESAKFTIKGQLKIIAPNGGEPYYVSTAQDIEWQYAGTISSNLDFYLDDNSGTNGYLTQINQAGSIAYNLAEDVSNICYYGWTTPATVGTKYRVKIVPSDATQADEVTSAADFPVKGNVTLVEPGVVDGADTWTVTGVSNTIDWTVTGGIPTVDIWLDTDGAPYTNQVSIVQDHDATVKPYAWAIPDDGTREAVTSDTCGVIIYDGNDNTVSDDSTFDFPIKPVLSLVTPLSTLPTPPPWYLTQAPAIQWTSSGSIDKLRLYYSNDDGNSWNLEKDNIDPASGEYNWDIDLVGGYEKVTDNLGKIKLVRVETGVEDNDVESEAGTFSVYGVLASVVLDKTSYNINTPATVDWTSTGNVGNVEIVYSTDSPTFGDASFDAYSPIATGIAADYCTNVPGTPYGFTVPNTVAAQVKVRVREMAFPTQVNATSDAVVFKGNIVLTPATTENLNLTVGTEHTITWTNEGTFNGIKISYIKDGGLPVEISTLPGSPESCPWTPGDADLSNDIVFRVEDANDAGVADETPGGSENTVLGSLDLTYPDGAEQLIVGDSGVQPGDNAEVKWIKQGNIGNLNIELSIDGSTWLTAAQSGLHADYPCGVSGVEQTYEWTIPDQISSDCYVRITSKGLTALGQAEVTDISTAKFRIKGSFVSITTPAGGATWYVDETNKDIVWNANGKMRAVNIDLDPGTGSFSYNIETEYTNGVTGLVDGENTYSGVTVPDYKSQACRIRVESFDNPATEIISSNFTIQPLITVTEIAGDIIAESTDTKIFWAAIAGTKTNTVNVKVDYGASTFPYTLGSGVAKTAGQGAGWTIANPFESTLSHTAKIRVEDAEIGYDWVKDDTANFDIVGGITITQPDGTDWVVGDATKKIMWTPKGDMGTLNIFADYGSGYGLPIATPLASAGEVAYTVPDEIYDGVKIKIEDAGEEAYTSVESTPFRIIGSLDLTYPNGTEDFSVGDYGGAAQIRWVKYGSLGNIKIEFSKVSDAGPWLTAAESNLPANGLIACGADGPTAVTYDWDIPDQVSGDCYIKISTTGDYPLNGTDPLSDVSAASFNIKGGISGITSPTNGNTFYVGENANIVWNANGAMRAVDIAYDAGAGYQVIENGYDDSGTGLVDGENTYVWTSVADERSQTCKIRVRSTDNPGIELESTGNFTIAPRITVTEIVGDLVAETNPTIYWNAINGLKTTQVNVKVDYAGGTGGFPYALGSNIPKADGVSGWVTTNPLEATLSHTAQIRVEDADVGYSYIKDETANFDIIGEITPVQPDGTDWVVAEARNITWTEKGNIGNVNIYVDYGGGESLLGTNIDADTSYPWPGNIPDQIGENIQIRLTDADEESYTTANATPFKIVGSLDLTYPNGGETLTVDAAEEVRWVKYGSIGNIKIELSTTSNAGPWLLAGDSNLSDSYPAGADGPAEVIYNWTIPDQISNSCYVKISTTAAYPIGGDTLTDVSDAVSGQPFNIRGGITGISAPLAGSTEYVGEATSITWFAVGSMRAVDIDLDPGTGSYSQNIVSGYDDAGAGLVPGNNTYPWPSVYDGRSESCKIRVRSTDNPLIDAETLNFTIAPRITVTEIVGDLVAETNPTIYWAAIAGTNTTLVNVTLDHSAGGGGFLTTLGTNVAKAAGVTGWVTANPLPATLSHTAQIRVADASASFVKDETANFSIIGEITICISGS